MTALRECPFCGSVSVTAERRPLALYPWRIACGGCCVTSDNYLQRGDAEEAWNTRAYDDDPRWTITPLGAALLEGKK